MISLFISGKAERLGMMIHCGTGRLRGWLPFLSVMECIPMGQILCEIRKNKYSFYFSAGIFPADGEVMKDAVLA